MLGYRREEKPVPLDQLYPVYLSEIDEYSEEERLFIECFDHLYHNISSIFQYIHHLWKTCTFLILLNIQLL